MTKIHVLQGKGMDMRGIEHIEIFGPQTLAEINQQVSEYATQLGLEATFSQSNSEEEAIQTIQDLSEHGVDGVLVNPAGFTGSAQSLAAAIAGASCPIYEIHVSNPSSRGIDSVIKPVCRGSIVGCGLFSYELGLRAIVDSLSQDS
ncbi:MAG: type II 3-dehydroquinate dehydratase [Pseudomonadota bacterium]